MSTENCTTKKCTRCGERFPKTEEYFSTYPKNGKRYFSSKCHKCYHEYQISLRRKQGIKPVKRSIERDGLKLCLGCEQWIPSTDEFWNKAPNGIGGLASRCKRCHMGYYYENHEENKLVLRAKHYRDKDDKNRKQRERYAIDPEYRAKTNKANRERPRSLREVEAARLYHQTHTRIKSEDERERDRQRAKKHYHKNKDEYNALRRSPEYKARNALQRLLNPTVTRSSKLRRRAREYALPDTFTKDDMQKCLDYWGNKCAITGETGKLEMDHWIPITHVNCPGTIPTNMIPMLKKWNRLKLNKEPMKFLVEHFGQEQAEVINRRVQDYFEWSRNR